MTDNPDFLENAQQITRNWRGTELSPDELVKEFHLYGHDRRAAILDDLDGQMRDVDTSNLRRYSRVTSLHRRLQTAHKALRDAGR